MASFGGETPYSIMFGPDICGFSTKKVHVILTKEGKNHLINKDIAAKSDELTHVYTLVIKPDNTYQVFILLNVCSCISLHCCRNTNARYPCACHRSSSSPTAIYQASMAERCVG